MNRIQKPPKKVDEEQANESRVIFRPSDEIVKGETDEQDVVAVQGGRWVTTIRDLGEVRQEITNSTNILNVEKSSGCIDWVTDAIVKYG